MIPTMMFQKIPIDASRFMTIEASQPATPPTIIAIIQPSIEFLLLWSFLWDRHADGIRCMPAPFRFPNGRIETSVPGIGVKLCAPSWDVRFREPLRPEIQYLCWRSYRSR